MNTCVNVLGMSVLVALVSLPALVGFVRERRIDRLLREAERARGDAPPEAGVAAQPVTAARRPRLAAGVRC
ncbi:hypothetical protein AB0L71_26270 [Streptomyces sp. NPDC052052]|uniref:hypothetical protein n=1 Tax=Streptomyces sp. NPDC052052 TaxID=3154756 RepID=UPI00343DB045